jgi:hypothetical protein
MCQSPSRSESLVFVSSVLYDGNLGGLTGADNDCNSLANAAHLPGTYRAWLSDSMTSAAARLTHGTVPYVLVDHTVVANDWAGLTSGTLLHAIDLTETGGAPPYGTLYCSFGGISVWTNTVPSGAQPTGQPNGLPVDCAEWMSTSSDRAFAGTASSTGPDWTANCSVSAVAICAETAAIYCIQQ